MFVAGGHRGLLGVDRNTGIALVPGVAPQNVLEFNPRGPKRFGAPANTYEGAVSRDGLVHVLAPLDGLLSCHIRCLLNLAHLVCFARANCTQEPAVLVYFTSGGSAYANCIPLDAKRTAIGGFVGCKLTAVIVLNRSAYTKLRLAYHEWPCCCPLSCLL